jgi:GTPase SAR1 family protein
MFEFIFKYVIIGDMGVGKSCLLHQVLSLLEIRL